MPRRRRKERPIPAAATAVEIAGYRAAELIDDVRDLLADFREQGKIPIALGMNPFGIYIELPPNEPPEEPGA